MKHIAIYMRVSTKKQDTASQEPDLRRWVDAFAKGSSVVWYTDQYSGKTMHRPGWNTLDKELKAGRVSQVVVWRLDRLGRTARGLTTLFEELADRTVGLVSLKEGLDLTTPAGRLMANVLASVAQFETEIRAERILAGQAAARAAGKRWGGSRRGRRTKVTLEQMSTIRRLQLENTSIAGIARATGLTRPTIYRYLEPSSVAECTSNNV